MAESISSTTSSSCRLDDGNSHSDSIVCQGFYSESSQPTEEDIHDYAKTIGIDPVKEPHLLHLAKEGLMRPLPANWQLCSADEIGDPYYYNVKTKNTQREHPLNEYYRQLVRQERQRHNEFPLKMAMDTNAKQEEVVPLTPSGSKVDVFGRNAPTRNSVKAKASMWDQAFDEVYNKVIHQEKVKMDQGKKGAAQRKPENGDVVTEEATDALETMRDNEVAENGKIPKNGKCDEHIEEHGATANHEHDEKAQNNSESSSTSSGPSVNSTGAIPKLYGSLASGSTANGNFSGNVNRFLETRSKNFPTNFKSQTRKGFNVKAGNEKYPILSAKDKDSDNELLSESLTERKGFTLSGTGSMFLKSRRHFGITSTEPPLNYKVVVEGEVGTPPGYKSILRETGLEEVKRRWQREFAKSDLRAISDTDADDKKNVRFNLEEAKIPSSSEEELNAEMSSESEDDGVDDVEDPWGDEELDEFEDLEHDDEEVNACVGIGTLPMEAVSYQRSLNPFLMNDERQMKDIKVTPVSKTQTIQMLKAQSFSIHMKAKEAGGGEEAAGSGAKDGVVSQNAVQYLDTLKETATVKPLYEDTDSDSKGSSDHSIVSNKPEITNMAHSPSNNPFEMDEVVVEEDQKHIEVVVRASEKAAVRSFKVASKLVGFLRKDVDKPDSSSKDKESDDNSFEMDKDRPLWDNEDGYESEYPGSNPFDFEELARRHNAESHSEKKSRGHKPEKSSMRSFRVASKLVNLLKKDNEKSSSGDTSKELEAQVELRESLEKQKQQRLKEEREKLEEQLQQEIGQIKKEHEQKLRSIREEYDLRLEAYRQETEEALKLEMSEYCHQMQEEYDTKRKAVVDEHKSQMATVQKNHAELLEELERDLKSEEEMIKKEHATKLQQMKDKLSDELEAERQRMKESGEERLYEKVRCEKRLLEDKYRCLKEKYARLKTEVKLSVERRNRRREAQALQQKNMHTTTTGSETERSTSHRPPAAVNSEHRSSAMAAQSGGSGSQASNKPPIPTKAHLAAANKDPPSTTLTERNSERVATSSSRRPGASPKYARHLRVQDDTTSVSQSDTTISNNYPKGRYLLAPTSALSDNGNSDSEAFASNVENNNNSRRGSGAGPPPQRKKQFTRLKSASTSRLNTDNAKNERPCTPVENLRHQLQKLEDLEDQLPDNALETTYHLRYPFSDISNADYAAGSSSELEFFKHRIHLERDSVRRAKESLRSQRTTFRARQREIKQRHNNQATRHSLEQLIQEEKDLTEMEVTLHRTRALLGEKVIRLRHLEQSVMRICDKAGNKASLDLLSVEPAKEDATLSDLSSQSSSGFSSTDLASGDTQNLNKRREFHSLESNECIKNLEILNAEIREILDLLGRGGQPTGLNIPMIQPAELNWSHMMGSAGTALSPTPDRRETLRQLSSGNTSTIDRLQNSIMAAKTIASQNPKAINYTNSLVERTRDIRNWLKQAKNEHELASPKSLGITSPIQASGQLTPNNASGSEGGISPVGAVGPSQANP
ncbi:centrosomal protein of 164 kDa isoform X2 [Musca domestica]|uniref:Centrosomal protein of 164 kDa isoform X2 n=1 Tax=Musca domestica TaxID=7370 RepID=A0ABM3UM44_MUSDO|nr:centrosomal protein of 164 kDa isoform X2 [Musca domestica]